MTDPAASKRVTRHVFEPGPDALLCRHCGHPRYNSVSGPDFYHKRGRSADPPASGDVEAAWDALRDDLARVSWSHRNAVIAKYRPIIEAAIRAEAETRLMFYEDQLRLTREQLTAIRAEAGTLECAGCRVFHDLGHPDSVPDARLAEADRG